MPNTLVTNNQCYKTQVEIRGWETPLNPSNNTGNNGIDAIIGPKLLDVFDLRIGLSVGSNSFFNSDGSVVNVGDIDGDGMNELLVSGEDPSIRALVFLEGVDDVGKVRKVVKIDFGEALCAETADEVKCREVVGRGEFVVSGLGDLNGDSAGDIAVLLYDRIVVVFMNKNGEVLKTKVSSIGKYLSCDVVNTIQKRAFQVLNVDDDERNEMAFITSSKPAAIPPLGSFDTIPGDDAAQPENNNRIF